MVSAPVCPPAPEIAASQSHPPLCHPTHSEPTIPRNRGLRSTSPPAVLSLAIDSGPRANARRACSQQAPWLAAGRGALWVGTRDSELQRLSLRCTAGKEEETENSDEGETPTVHLETQGQAKGWREAASRKGALNSQRSLLWPHDLWLTGVPLVALGTPIVTV